MAELQSYLNRSGFTISPGGFEFGLQGFAPGEPKVTSVTFYNDGTALVADQHGFPIRGILLDNGKEVRFAMSPPIADKQEIIPRPHLATHAQVYEALQKDLGIDLIDHMNKAGESCGRCKGSKVFGNGACPTCKGTGVLQVITCAGWPQLPYEVLKRLKELPPAHTEELRRIRDDRMRKDALLIRRERNEIRSKELAEEEVD